MIKKITSSLILLSACLCIFFFWGTDTQNETITETNTSGKIEKKAKKTPEQRYQFAQERTEFELEFQRDPQTGKVPRDQRILELQHSIEQSLNADISRQSENVYVQRGPSNLGGRTRSLVIDISDPSGNTMLAGAVSGGVFRTTNGGASWTKVSPNREIHNVTAIAQDPRPGFQNIWYYATGENLGNSASLGSFFPGQGVWRSEDGGLNWEIIPETDSTFEVILDSFLDVNNALAVSPITGDLFIASFGRIHRYDGNDITIELQEPGTNGGLTDVQIDSNGRVYATIRGTSPANGVYTSETGNGSWVRIAQNGDPAGWNANAASGRIVVSTVPSNENLLYALYTNGADSGVGNIEADLWRYDLSTDTWTDFSSKLPDLPGGPIRGVDPFSVQGGYDLNVTVRPDDENFVIIAGTSAYRIENIETDDEFGIIGGYNGAMVALYDTPNGDIHHPDVHALVFNPFDNNVFFTGTDGGIHRTDDINSQIVDWVNLNNNYQTYQYYHVALDQVEGSNIVLGGAQDNSTTIGGTDVVGVGGIFVPTIPTPPNNTEMVSLFGGDGVAVGIARRGDDNDVQLYLGSQGGQIITNFPTPRDITPNTADSSIFVTYFYLDPDNTNTLYYADGATMYRTNNAQNVNPGSWTNLGTLPGGQGLRQFSATRGTYDEASSFMLIGGSSGGVFRLDDPQNAADLSGAINITPPGASTAGGTIVSGIALHPTNPDIAMVVYANYNISNIFITSDATSDTPTWTLVERNLAPHSIRSAAITEVDGQIAYYVGTARGLYSNADPTTFDWALEGSGTLGLALISGLVYRPSDNRLLIGTHGNGMFDTEATLLSVDDVTATQRRDDLTIFPNPATDIINFSTRSFAGIRGFRVIDYSGRILEEGTIDGVSQSSLDISKYSSGVYFLSVTTQNNEQIVSQFIKR